MEHYIKRHEAWRLQYRRDPYLRSLPKSELCSRGGDLMTGMLQHGKDGRIAVSPIDEDWSKAERFTHVLEELAIRGLDHREPAIVKALKAPEPNSPKVRRALKVLAKKNWSDSILVKFGERRYMRSLFLEGKGRLSLARTYIDPSLGSARLDDESQVDAYVDPMDAHRLMAVEQTEGGSRAVDVEVPHRGALSFSVRASTDFYVYCMAESCDARMFDDFTTETCNVDTCLVATRPEEFKARLREAIAGTLPSWKALDCPVIYFDPFFARVHQVVPHFYKHFRFDYQKEHRFVWLPRDTGRPQPEPSDHIYFDIGPLTDCAELIWL